MRDFTYFMSEFEPIYYSWDVLMESSKSDLLDLYRFHKGHDVYFVNKEGKWLLDSKGDVRLIKE